MVLHVRLKLVTIYIWQRMAASTEHPCGWGPPLAWPPMQVSPPPASWPAGRARHPDRGTSGLGTEHLSPFSCPSHPPRPPQGAGSSPCAPGSARRQARAAAGEPRSARHSGDVPRETHGSPRASGTRVRPQRSPAAPAVPGSQAARASPSAARRRSALRPAGPGCTRPRARLAVGEDYRVRMATGYSRDICSAPLMGSLRLA